MPGSPARKLGDRETGGALALPVWIEYMQTALKDVPQVPLVPPEGAMNVNGEWYYDEFGPANAVTSLGLDDKLPQQTTDDEKKSIRYLFKTGNWAAGQRVAGRPASIATSSCANRWASPGQRADR